jgi:hypothetical protein
VKSKDKGMAEDEDIISTETSVNVYRITGHHVSEDSVLSSQ